MIYIFFIEIVRFYMFSKIVLWVKRNYLGIYYVMKSYLDKWLGKIDSFRV